MRRRRNWQFGKSLGAAIGWAVQQALKGYGKAHPDPKRQRKSRLRDAEADGFRKLKRPMLDIE